MKKIPSLFQRNYDTDRLVRDEVVEGCEWVLKGEGIPTRKWDGTCVMVRDGIWFKRYDNKKGHIAPADFIPCMDLDPTTGHQTGWIFTNPDNPADKWLYEAISDSPTHADGTYELCGPKINGNPERFEFHRLIKHGIDILPDCKRNFEGIRTFLIPLDIEGIVWHHPDGRMCKIKKKDFGMKRSEIKEVII